MKELLSAVYKRRSIRQFSDTKLTQEELKKVTDYLAEAKKLLPDIKVDYEIVPCSETSCKFNAEYCLMVYSEKKEHWLLNIGYWLAQWDLYLASQNIGVCWYAMGKTEKGTLNDLHFAIMLAFGKCSEDSYRKSLKEFNRKEIAEFWKNPSDLAVAEVARLAPSDVNSQPWKVVEKNNVIKVSREKGSSMVTAMLLFNLWNKMDMGCFLAFLEIGLESQGYTFERTLHPEVPDKKSVLTATYKIKK